MRLVRNRIMISDLGAGTGIVRLQRFASSRGTVLTHSNIKGLCKELLEAIESPSVHEGILFTDGMMTVTVPKRDVLKLEVLHYKGHCTHIKLAPHTVKELKRSLRKQAGQVGAASR